MQPSALTWFFSAVAFAVSISATPGPNNAMVASSGATFGFARTLPHILGITVGFPVMLIAVALGAGDLLRAAPTVHEFLRWAGAAYLLWLAFRIATSAPSMKDAKGRAKPLSFLQAALFQWVNPKGWIAAISAIVTFTSAGGPILPQAALLAAIFFVTVALAVAFWTMTGVGAARLLRTARSVRAFNLTMASLLVASLVPLLRES
jgi:threonine/homoserine/homoserine lactone efflux protein